MLIEEIFFLTVHPWSGALSNRATDAYVLFSRELGLIKGYLILILLNFFVILFLK